MEMLLNQQELLDLGDELQGVNIVCREGQCWITQSGDSRDHILKSGESFTIRTQGRVIVTATQSSRLMLTDSNEASRLKQPLKTVFSVLKSCMTSSFNAHLS